MYKAHFGLAEHPFSLTPDTDYFFGLKPHTEALQVLMMALHQGEGFIKVTGEVGTGKTMVCRKLLNLLTDDYQVAYLPNPNLSAQEVNQALASELNIEQEPENSNQLRLSQRLQQRLIELATENIKVVLLLDEAQALSHDALESLRLLGNLETEKQKLLQIVLFGQPELNQRLNQHTLRQLNQRITFNYNLRPLELNEVMDYIEHRLYVSGYRGAPLISTKSFKLIHKSSGGIPRLVNILCHKSLMLSYGKGERSLSTKVIKVAINDTQAAKKKAVNFFKVLATACLCCMTSSFIVQPYQFYLGV